MQKYLFSSFLLKKIYKYWTVWTWSLIKDSMRVSMGTVETDWGKYRFLKFSVWVHLVTEGLKTGCRHD